MPRGFPISTLLVLAAVLAAPGCAPRPLLAVDGVDGGAMALAALRPELSTTSPPPPIPSYPVRTVRMPGAEPRPISLAECVALALENGRLGPRNIRVLAFEPAVAGAAIEQSLARFDARYRGSILWSSLDRPGALPFGLDAGQLPNSDARQETAQLLSELVKPLPTGGLAGITFRTDYDLVERRTRADALYRPILEFNFEQPLLQGAGVAINQLRDSHPVTGAGGPGILLARIDFDRRRIDFEGQVQDLLFTVEQAYWSLYTSYWTLYSRDVALRQALETWRITKVRYDRRVAKRSDLAQVEQQYQSFRVDRLAALGDAGNGVGVLESERALRLAIGLPPEDGTRLVPTDRPTDSPYHPDWEVALAQAMANRPDLLRARADVKSAQLALIRERDFLRPDVRAFGLWNVNAIGNRLDGPGAENALRNLASNQFNDWTVGVRVNAPVGFREAHARVRRAELQLAQSMAALRNQEEQAAFDLQRSYRAVIQEQERVRLTQARRTAAAAQLESLSQEYLAGEGLINVLLLAQRDYADALRDEQVARTAYNVALVDFERQKGTLLHHDNVTIAEGPIPECVAARASEHIRRRQHALVLRERPAPDTEPPVVPAVQKEERLPALEELLHRQPGLCDPVAPQPELEKPAPPSDGSKVQE